MRPGGRLLLLWVTAAALAGCGGGDGGAGPSGGGEGSGANGVSGESGSGAGGGGSSATGAVAAEAWLTPHNTLRAGTLAGVTLDPMPSPALPALVWSASAEAVARAWAEGCDYRHNPGRNAGGVPRGENIAATAPAGRADVTPAWVVGQWGSEWADYRYASNSCGAGRVCGHYTQLVWRATTHVGCARATCNSPFGAQYPTWDYFVCNYEPPGNYTGQKPY